MKGKLPRYKEGEEKFIECYGVVERVSIILKAPNEMSEITAKHLQHTTVEMVKMLYYKTYFMNDEEIMTMIDEQVERYIERQISSWTRGRGNYLKKRGNNE